MADQKRFKQKRDFKTRLGEEPEERQLSGDRNFGKGKYVREDRRFGRDDRKFGRKEGGHHNDRRDDKRDDKRENRFSGRDGEGRKGRYGNDKFGDGKFGKRDFNRKNNKSFNKFRRDDED